MPRVNILTTGLATSLTPAEIQYVKDFIKSLDKEDNKKDDKK